MAIRDRDLEIDHMTERDPLLAHQVILTRAENETAVSCNCLFNETHGYETMGTTMDIETSRLLYNNPDNHRLPFTEEDRAKW